MIPWVKVGEAWKQPSLIWAKADDMWHLLDGTTSNPYNKALKLVGLDKVDSLDEVLASSEMCEALAGNAEAVTIMKDNYSADMVTAINNAWNEGLNTLNYKCGLKCWLFKDGNQCSGITGGWGIVNKGLVDSTRIGIAVGSPNPSYVYTNNAIDGSFSNVYFVIDQINAAFKCGIASNQGSDSWLSYSSVSATGIETMAFTPGGYPSVGGGSNQSTKYAMIGSVYLE